MLERELFEQICRWALEWSQAEQTEVLIQGRDESLTRFAENTIHQNVFQADVTVRVRAVWGTGTGVATGHDLNKAAIRGVVEAAQTLARFGSENRAFMSLPAPQPVPQIECCVEGTAAISPQVRARGCATICSLARDNGLMAAGYFSTLARERMVANSLGVWAYHRWMLSEILTVALGDNSSGYASGLAQDASMLDPEAIGRIAIDKALRGRNPIAVPPGDYTVILEEAAVANLLAHLARLGLGGMSVQDGESFLCGHLGERVTGTDITIWDDGLDRRGICSPFDYEGVPRQQVTLIEGGIAKGAVHDSFTAGREEGRQSTGHALPMPNTTGPVSTNLFMATGSATKDKMIASTRRGVWVTRLHYTNPVDRSKTILTGMTRDGTFLIENGEIVHPIKNLRFTQSILEAFSRVELLGNTAKLIQVEVDDIDMICCVPAVKIGSFHFSGTSSL